MRSILGKMQDDWFDQLKGLRVDMGKLNCWNDLSDSTQNRYGYPLRDNTYLMKFPTQVDSPYSADINIYLFLEIDGNEIKSLSYSTVGIDYAGKKENIAIPLLEPDVVVVENHLYEIVSEQDIYKLEQAVDLRLRMMPMQELEMAKGFFTEVNYDQKQQDKYDKVICEINNVASNKRKGAKNVGEFKDGRRHGQGTRVYPNGSKYVGEWKEGLCHGHGTWSHPDGFIYVGEWKDDNLNGQGSYTWADGRKYVGGFKDGKMHGQGSYTTPDGVEYVGEWKDGKFHGQGDLIHHDGKKYIGELKDAKAHGQGTLTYPDGDKYTGEWKDGFMHGEGTYTYADGGEYVGGWKLDKRHGQGSYTWPDGRVESGTWKNDELVGP